jgi:hypothetical protein
MVGPILSTILANRKMFVAGVAKLILKNPLIFGVLGNLLLLIVHVVVLAVVNKKQNLIIGQFGQQTDMQVIHDIV